MLLRTIVLGQNYSGAGSNEEDSSFLDFEFLELSAVNTLIMGTKVSALLVIKVYRSQ